MGEFGPLSSQLLKIFMFREFRARKASDGKLLNVT